MSGWTDRLGWTAAILRVLSDLAPSPAQARYDVSGSGATAMAWLGLEAIPGSQETITGRSTPTPFGTLSLAPNLVPTFALDRSGALDELAQYDSFTPGLDDLSIGWMWAVGSMEVDGERRDVLCPLVSSTVHLRRQLGGYLAIASPSWDLWPFVTDPAVAEVLESSIEFGRGGLPRTKTMSQAYLARFPAMLTWVNSVLGASGLHPLQHITVPKDPRRAQPNGLEVILGYGIYANHGGDLLRPQVSLAAWANTPGIGDTAFSSLYVGPRKPPGTGSGAGSPPPPPRQLRSTLPLSAAQEQAVRRSFDQDLVVVSGPPGTGKSQTAVAIASDAVARGERVLVATQSAMAADVLAELLDRVPGPTPVLFGGGKRATELAAKLADGLTTTVDHGTHDRWRQAQRAHDQLADAVGEDLAGVAALEQWTTLQLTVDLQRRHAPRLYERDDEAAIDEALELLARCHEHHGLLDDLRHTAESRLRHLVDAPDASTSRRSRTPSPPPSSACEPAAPAPGTCTWRTSAGSPSSKPTKPCGPRPARRPLRTSRAAPTGTPGGRSAPSPPPCAPAGPDAAPTSPGSTSARSPRPSPSGSARSPTSRRCCPPCLPPSTSSSSTRPP
ncbi:MAG: AAA domain-containing protein [Acidimicrobiales bacterium]